jgi:hypothetical protein
MSTPVKVQLGNHELDVYAQRHAYLANKLGKFVSALAETGSEITSDKILSFGQERVYELLCVVIPQLGKRMPEYEFLGYASKEAQTAGEYDPEQDKSPTVPEIHDALVAVGRVNRFDILKHLGKVFDPDLVRAAVNQQVAAQVLKTSPSSPSTNGDSAPTSSGTTPPTPTQSAASQSPA